MSKRCVPYVVLEQNTAQKPYVFIILGKVATETKLSFNLYFIIMLRLLSICIVSFKTLALCFPVSPLSLSPMYYHVLPFGLLSFEEVVILIP